VAAEVGFAADPLAFCVTCGRMDVFHLSVQHVHFRPLFVVAQIYKLAQKWP